ncbi:hypothetical protein CLM62_12625 [Streptomyces sp. SA15]|uniref:hypothetical protein n=1 Tax=Streptomyces sp. SA15 TaxID=934019 RepID=UPI000BAFB523|nr:hypothetical protein [Streptomyces sp. SA15]PAZ15634.1 hypothetical protein CLM62_12625 [Streptomyces sp. SA15]
MTTAADNHPDCEPAWTDDYQPSDHTPTRFDLRQHEMRDLRDQGPGPVALWTADTLPTGEYL